MKKVLIVNMTLLVLLTAPFNRIEAQAGNCIFKPPVVNIDFGSYGRDDQSLQIDLENYEQTLSHCPNDGYYSFATRTSNCYGGNWITLTQDHTPNDVEGKMMLVNASYPPGTFFTTPLKGLLPNTTYELGTWMVNVCTGCNNSPPLSPHFGFIIEDASGKAIASFGTGKLPPTGRPSWIQYSALFTTPANAQNLFLRIINKERGGCGNDFAMDDITIRECIRPEAIVKNEQKAKPLIKPPVVATKPVPKKKPLVVTPIKKEIPAISKTRINEPTPVVVKPETKPKPIVALPKALITRANPVVKQIETGQAEVVIDLYDNGEIDGDTVTIYHNNILLISRAGLSAKPVTLKLPVDKAHAHHELVMVANNLGSIPPNTSLMVITAMDKRYEVFISSSEQKNAKVIINLKE